jgi:hypothetical protein
MKKNGIAWMEIWKLRGLGRGKDRGVQERKSLSMSTYSCAQLPDDGLI